MQLAELSLPTLILLFIPALVNLWAIWHTFTHEFSSTRQRMLWMLVTVFVPLIGGTIYLIFGYKKSGKKIQKPALDTDINRDNNKDSNYEK